MTVWDDVSQLVVEVDKRGFILGESIIGANVVSDTDGGLVDITGDLTEVNISHGVQVSGVEVMPETSSASFSSKTDLSQYIGYPATISLVGVTAWTGLLDDVSYTQDADVNSPTGVSTTWTMEGHGLELLRLQAPPVSSVRQSVGVRSGAATNFETPWSPSQPTYAAFLEAVSGVTTAVEGYSVPPSDADTTFVMGGVPSAKACVYQLGHMLRSFRMLGIANIDQGTQGEILSQLALLVGGRVTSAGAIVRRDYTPASLTLTDDSLRGASGGRDKSIPQGVSFKNGTRQVVASYGSKDWTDKDFDTALFNIRASAHTYTSTFDNSTDPENIAVRKLLYAAAMTPVVTKSTIAATSVSIDPNQVTGSINGTPYVVVKPWHLPLPWSASIDGKTRSVIGVNHAISPGSWTVDLELGPEYLISRTNDLLPKMPKVTGVTRPNSSTLRITVSVSPGETVRAIGGSGVFNAAEAEFTGAGPGLMYELKANSSGVAVFDLPWGAPPTPGEVAIAVYESSRRCSAPVVVRYGQAI